MFPLLPLMQKWYVNCSCPADLPYFGQRRPLGTARGARLLRTQQPVQHRSQRRRNKGRKSQKEQIREAEEKVQHNEESSFAAAFRLLDNYFKEDTKL